MKYSYSERAAHPEPTRTTYQKIVDRRPVDYKQGSELFANSKRAKKRKILAFLGTAGLILLFILFAIDPQLEANTSTKAGQPIKTNEILRNGQEFLADLDDHKQRLINLRMHNVLRARSKSLYSSKPIYSPASQTNAALIKVSEEENISKNQAIKQSLVATWESSF